LEKPITKEKKKGSGGVAQVVESWPSKHEALSSKPFTEKRKDGGLLIIAIPCSLPWKY
jgi:hypothetical protein